MGDETVPMSRLLDEVAIKQGGCKPALWEQVIARGDEAAEHLLGKMENTDGDDIPRIARVLLKMVYDGRFERDGNDLYFRRMTKPGYVVPYELAVSIHSRVKERIGIWKSTLETAGLGHSTAEGLELSADECLRKAERIMWEDIAFGLFEEARDKGIAGEDDAIGLIGRIRPKKEGWGPHVTDVRILQKMRVAGNHSNTLAQLVCSYVKEMEERHNWVQMAMAAQSRIKRAGECCKALGIGGGKADEAKGEGATAREKERESGFDVDGLNGLILTRAVQNPWRAAALEAGEAIVDELLGRMERQVESKRIWIPKDARMMDTDDHSAPVNENPYEAGAALINLCDDGRYHSEGMHERKMGTFDGVLPFEVSMRALGGIVGWTIKREAVGLPEYELSQVRVFRELADNARRNVEQMNYEYMALQLALSFTQVNVREGHIIEGHLKRVLDKGGRSVWNAAQEIAQYARSMDYTKRMEQVPLIARELRLLNFNRENLAGVRSDLGIMGKRAPDARGANAPRRAKPDESPAGKLVARLSQGGLGDFQCYELVNMGMRAADALLGTFPQPNAGNKLQMAKAMVEIAGKNPAEAKSIEMMEMLGKWLGKKKAGGKDRKAKQKSAAEFSALRDAYRDVARKMGLDEKKAMPGPKGKKSRREKKGKKNLNVN